MRNGEGRRTDRHAQSVKLIGSMRHHARPTHGKHGLGRDCAKRFVQIDAELLLCVHGARHGHGQTPEQVAAIDKVFVLKTQQARH